MNALINGVRIDGLFELAGQILEPIPEAERAGYAYFRVVHLGAICLNWIQGDYTLNTAGSGSAYLTCGEDRYNGALAGYGPGNPDRQFPPQEAAKLAALTGRELPPNLPSMIFGVRDDCDHAIKAEGREAICHGKLGIIDIDPYSAKELESIFGVPYEQLAAPSSRPGLGRVASPVRFWR